MRDIHDYIIVPENYKLTFETDVYSLLENGFKKKLDDFTEKHLLIQKAENYSALPSKFIADFPFIEYPAYKDEIYSRKQDISLLGKILREQIHSKRNVLELGAWNGWLSKWLSNRDMEVLSADIFQDQQNGLQSRKYHKNANWTSIQFDFSDPGIIKKKFDLIIFNHCLQFLPSPLQLVQKYKANLAENGMIVLLGLTFSKGTEDETKRIDLYRRKYLERHNFSIHFYPCKGFFDYADKEAFLNVGFKFRSYSHSVLGRIRNMLRAKKSGIMLFQASK